MRVEIGMQVACERTPCHRGVQNKKPIVMDDTTVAPRPSLPKPADFERNLLAYSTGRGVYPSGRNSPRVSREAVESLCKVARVGTSFFAYEALRALNNAEKKMKKATSEEREQMFRDSMLRAIEKLLGSSRYFEQVSKDTRLDDEPFRGALPFAPTHALLKAIAREAFGKDRVKKRTTLVTLRVMDQILGNVAEEACRARDNRAKVRATVMERDVWQALSSEKFGPLGFRMRQQLNARLPESSRPSLKAHNYQASDNQRQRRSSLRAAVKASNKNHVLSMLKNGKRLMEMSDSARNPKLLANVEGDISYVSNM